MSEAFTFTDWDGVSSRLRFLAWRSGHNGLLLRDAAGHPRILSIHFASFDEEAGAVPEAVPLEITPARLIAPPCIRSAKEAAVFNGFVGELQPGDTLEVVEQRYMHALAEGGLPPRKLPPFWFSEYGEVLAPHPGDWPELEVHLAHELPQLKVALHDLHASDLKQIEWAGMYAPPCRQPTGRLHPRSVGLDSQSMRRRRWAIAHALRVQARTGASEFEALIATAVRELELSFERAPRLLAEPAEPSVTGQGRPRRREEEAVDELDRPVWDAICAWLQQRWAENHGFSLAEMQKERDRFEAGVLSSLAGEKHRHHELQAALGAVRYALTTTERKVYLRGAKLRPPVTAAEQAEFASFPEERLTPEAAENALGLASDPRHRILRSYCEEAELDFENLRQTDLPVLRYVRSQAKKRQGAQTAKRNAERRD
jgi:hypothetical protein